MEAGTTEILIKNLLFILTKQLDCNGCFHDDKGNFYFFPEKDTHTIRLDYDFIKESLDDYISSGSTQSISSIPLQSKQQNLDKNIEPIVCSTKQLRKIILQYYFVFASNRNRLSSTVKYQQ